MRWYGHVMRRDEEYVGKRAMGTEVQGNGRRGTERTVTIMSHCATAINFVGMRIYNIPA